MKRNFLLLAIIGFIAATGCQKNLENNQIKLDKLSEVNPRNIVVDCTPITLSGSITTNTTLLTGKTYLLDGVVDVKNATLTIQPGTLILGKSSVPSALVIDRTAQINAVGTATSPIVFTSDKAPGSRAAGDWIGLAIMGNAPNNQGNALGFNISSNSYTAGGTSAGSSAGSLEYVQVHYAGSGSSTGDQLTQSALILGSIGSGMTIRNIQITNSEFDGLGVWGGQVGVKQVFSYKSTRKDFAVSQGYRGNMQHLFGFKDNAVHASLPNSYSIDITNNLVGSNNAPYTYPTISNASVLGGTYCDNSDANYQDAIAIRLNGNARIFNSVVEGFNRYGLFLDGDNVVAKTAAATDRLEFSYNSFHDLNGTPEYFAQVTSSWSAAGGCIDGSTNNMTNWITGTLSAACSQVNNQLSLAATGYYKNSLCGDKCSTFPNLFINESTTDLETPEYGMLSGFFDQPDFRGSLQSSTDTWLKNTWVDFCMLTRDYCE